MVRGKDGNWHIAGVKSNGAGGPEWDSVNEYTRLGGIAYDWLMRNIMFDKTTKKPVPWVKIDAEKCKEFEPSEQQQDYGDEGDIDAPWN